MQEQHIQLAEQAPLVSLGTLIERLATVTKPSHRVPARGLTSCGQLRLDPCTGMSKHWHGGVSLGHLPDAQAVVCAGHAPQTLEQQLHNTWSAWVAFHRNLER